MAEFNLTPGPWEWREKEFDEKYCKKKRDGTLIARAGRKIRDRWIMLLTGPQRYPIGDGEKVDEWDYPHIIALRWEDLKTSSWSGGPSENDMKLIAASPVMYDFIFQRARDDDEEAQSLISGIHNMPFWDIDTDED